MSGAVPRYIANSTRLYLIALAFLNRFEVEVNANQLTNWIGDILHEMAVDLYRYKGILAVKGAARKYVFQGVHMIHRGDFTDTEWKTGEKRECRFVFIGRNLNEKLLRDGFMACRVVGPLRFKVGDRVQARASRWMDGNVFKLWEEGNPYRIRLDDGSQLWVPIDTNEFVREPRKAK